MQLDQNRIAIRERGYLEILDLTLRVIRAYAGPLAAALAVGVVPAMLLNAWLMAGTLDVDPESRFPLLYMLADVPPGALGGAAGDRPGHACTWGNRCSPSRSDRQDRPQLRRLAAPVDALPGAVCGGCCCRWCSPGSCPSSLWPYLNEVILLERNPLRPRPGAADDHQPPHDGPARRFRRRPVRAVDHRHAGRRTAVPFRLGFPLRFWRPCCSMSWEGSMLAYTLYYPLALWITAGFLCRGALPGLSRPADPPRRLGSGTDDAREGARLERQLI